MDQHMGVLPLPSNPRMHHCLLGSCLLIRCLNNISPYGRILCSHFIEDFIYIEPSCGILTLHNEHLFTHASSPVGYLHE